MIEVYCLRIADVHTVSFESIKEKLSETDQKRYGKLLRPADRTQFLAGRFVLDFFLKKTFSKASIREIVRDQYKRPFIPGGKAFSISHAENTVAVAFAGEEGEKIGVDIETEKPLELEDYLIAFSEAEKSFLLNGAHDKTKVFYRLWTRKESLMKAIGSGFLMDPVPGPVLDEHVRIHGRSYYFSQPLLQEGLTASVCSSCKAEVSVHQLSLA